MKARCMLIVSLSLGATTEVRAVPVGGQVANSLSANAVGGARVTLFTTNLQFFREVRTTTGGVFSFQHIGEGSYRLGVAARGFEYIERAVTVSNTAVSTNFFLQSETNGGRWTIVGNTEPELLDGSGSGTLLPSGEIFFCHDTEDPIMFDPVSGMKWYPPDSLSAQGCHIVTLNTDGGMFLTGGSMGGNPQDPVVKIAKTYWRNTNVWIRNADMGTGRWYPGLVRLADERLLILGGELNGPAFRTNGCEIYNPVSNTWSNTGSFNLPTEIPPAMLLYSGEVLKTWRYPELFNPTSGTWRAAAPMIQPRTGAAGGDHADHEAILLPDGRVMAVGVFPITPSGTNRFCEFYNPTNNSWSLGPNPRALRHRPEVLMLPDGRVLSFGGQYSGTNPAPVALANAGTIPNCTKVADIYDGELNSWRPLADMNRFIHYHNVTLLVPDGRVIATGGAGLTSNRSFAGDDSSIEAFEPPYLFRGVRPRIDVLSTADLVVGSNFTLRVSLTEGITKLALVSARAATHWNDGGPQRFLELDFQQSGSEIVASVPSSAIKAVPGFYILFAMVDDIPSIGRIVRITPTPVAPLTVPTVSMIVATTQTEEPIINIGQYVFTRTGPSNAPLTVGYSVGGTALNGIDYANIPNYVVFPAGTNTARLYIFPKQDTFSESNETVTVNFESTTAYRAVLPPNRTVIIRDDDTGSPPLSLQLSNALNWSWQLALSGPATRAYELEGSTTLTNWQRFATLVTGTNTAVRLLEGMETNYLFFRARVME